MNKSVLLVIALLGGALFITGCKNNDSPGTPACQAGTVWNGSTCMPNTGTFPGGYGYPGQMGACPAGQLQTQYGCLAQGTCQVGMAMYNNQCIPGNIGTVGGMGQYPNTYLGGQYPNGYPYGSYPYGSTYNQYPYGMNNGGAYNYWYWYYGF